LIANSSLHKNQTRDVKKHTQKGQEDKWVTH